MSDETTYRSMREFDKAMFPAWVERQERAAETPREAGERAAREAIERLGAER